MRAAMRVTGDLLCTESGSLRHTQQRLISCQLLPFIGQSVRFQRPDDCFSDQAVLVAGIGLAAIQNGILLWSPQDRSALIMASHHGHNILGIVHHGHDHNHDSL